MLFGEEEVQTRSLLYSSLVSRRRQRKVVDKGALFATPMISQGILRGVQTMWHCGRKDGGVHIGIGDISVCTLTITAALSYWIDHPYGEMSGYHKLYFLCF